MICISGICRGCEDRHKKAVTLKQTSTGTESSQPEVRMVHIPCDLFVMPMALRTSAFMISIMLRYKCEKRRHLVHSVSFLYSKIKLFVSKVALLLFSMISPISHHSYYQSHQISSLALHHPMSFHRLLTVVHQSSSLMVR